MNCKNYLSSLFVTLVSLFLITANATGSWVTTVVDSSGSVGLYTSIALDTSGTVHISYYDTTNDDLKYATNATGSWVTETVDSNGGHTSIAIDSSDKVHISYYDDTNLDLKYATNATGSWITTTMASSKISGSHTSIAIDSSDKVHISYFQFINFFEGNLKYVTNATGSWVTETVDSDGIVGWYTSIALDPSDKVHISYYDNINQDLKYVTNATGPWATTTVDSSGDVGQYTSIALDTSGKVHISYYQNINFIGGDLKYSTNASGSWVTTVVDSSGIMGLGTSIALDSSDKVHISYYYVTNQDLKYATNATGSWVTETVDSGGRVGLYTSIVLDTSDKVHISYYDATNGYLKYATNPAVPLPGILANGSEGSVTISTGELLTIAVSLTSGGYSGTDADWWIIVNTPSGWQYYDLDLGDYTPGLMPSLQGFSLLDFGSNVIFNTPGLGAGTYTYYFAVYVGGQWFFDSVVVTVTAIDPSPQITANGSEVTVNINEGDPLTIAIGLSSGSFSGTSADWWIVVNTSSGWQYYDLNLGDYTPGLMPSLQGFSLVDFGSTVIFNTSGLGADTYTYYFAIDPGGGQLYYASVVVNITP